MSDVRAECKRRFGNEPCSTVFNAKGEPDAKECADWCPLLRRRIEEEDDDADLVNDARDDRILGRMQT